MSFEVLIREAVADATRAVNRRLRAGERLDRARTIAEAAADLCLERSPRLADRMTREKLLEFITPEVGN